MKRRNFIPLLAAAPVFAQQTPYERRQIQGWTVVVSRRLLDEEAPLASEAIKLLETKLKEVVHALPAEAVEKLRAVPVWLEHQDNGAAKCAAYHPSAKWLTDHGHNPNKARSVEFANPTLFIQWSEIQPSMVLHEMAHAYHHQVLTHSFEPIASAYKQALNSGLYAEVKHAKGKARRAYALNNQKEFFAELSEAYFGRNDFFPFNRMELREYDPKGYAAIEVAWKTSA